jgi:hypothetical protein
MPPPVFTLAKLSEWMVKNVWRFIKKFDEKSVRVSLAVVLVVVAADVLAVWGIASLTRPKSPPAPEYTHTRLADDVDLGRFCGDPASGNLIQSQCQWRIPDFNKVCEWQYPAAQYPALPHPIRMSFSDPLNPSSGQCYASDGQLAGGVKMTGYCNAVLAKRPSGVDYDATPVKNTNQWICARKLDILAACVSTFQSSNLEARIEGEKVICYARERTS